MTESVGNASLGGSPSEDFLTGDFTAKQQQKIIYINIKFQVLMVAKVSSMVSYYYLQDHSSHLYQQFAILQLPL
jgi:hypothetical protein